MIQKGVVFSADRVLNREYIRYLDIRMRIYILYILPNFI